MHTGLFGYGGPPHPVSAAPACRKEPPARNTAPAEHPKGISREAPCDTGKRHTNRMPSPHPTDHPRIPDPEFRHPSQLPFTAASPVPEPLRIQSQRLAPTRTDRSAVPIRERRKLRPCAPCHRFERFGRSAAALNRLYRSSAWRCPSRIAPSGHLPENRKKSSPSRNPGRGSPKTVRKRIVTSYSISSRGVSVATFSPSLTSSCFTLPE